jgi:hypothetical protein
MKFDARTNEDPKNHEAFIDWLSSETVSGLTRASGDPDALHAVVFLYLSRSYEAHLDPDLICDLLGVHQTSILTRAGLSKSDEAVVTAAYGALDPVLEKQYKGT